MERHVLLARHAAPPSRAVEAHRHLARLFGLDVVTPFAEAAHGPFGGVFVCVGADGASAEAVAENVEVLHGAVVVARRLHDLLDRCALREARRGQREKQKRLNEKSFHSSSL